MIAQCDKASQCDTGAADRQRGAALPVTMILLVVLAVLAISGLDDSAMQERMSGNMRDRDIAFQAAEAALRSGERWLQNNQATASGNLALDGLDAIAWNGTSPAPSGSRTALYATGTEVSVASNPVYYASAQQLIRKNPGETPAEFREIFPVIARGVGGTDTAVVILRSTFEPL